MPKQPFVYLVSLLLLGLTTPQPATPPVRTQLTTRIYNGPLPHAAPQPRTSARRADGLVDNWQSLLEEGFEASFPSADCYLSDQSADGYERWWAADSGRAATDSHAGWPAKGGADGVNPGSYPANLDSWLICGPYDLTEADNLLLAMSLWLEINDEDDGLFMGVSTDGTLFTGSSWSGHSDWFEIERTYPEMAGEATVYVGWQFHSNDHLFNNDEGAWLDDLQIWRYNTPSATCGDHDGGGKGVVLPPYDPTTGGEAPMIRPGDTLAVQRMQIADVSWVRLGLNHKGGRINLRAYDRMVDTLCAAGMSVLGLINHESLDAEGYNSPDEAVVAAYRADFAQLAGAVAEHYRGRITYWEVWNEPNLTVEAGGPFVRPELYAPLLNESYQAIKSANPQAQVLFGGLASAWDDSHGYFVDVYTALGELGVDSPFDLFAVHPYPNELEGTYPDEYLRAVPDSETDQHTLIDKFLKTMSGEMDGDIQVWITEVGWNSAKGVSNRPVCHELVLVTEAQQAEYVPVMLDILFNEVTLWEQPTVPAVEKVIWYQYMDVGTTDPCGGALASESHAYVEVQEMTTEESAANVAWLFGLYRSDKVTPKPAWCPFAAYPRPCQRILLPTISAQ